jgi:hypothetical protein
VYRFARKNSQEDGKTRRSLILSSCLPIFLFKSIHYRSGRGQPRVAPARRRVPVLLEVRWPAVFRLAPLRLAGAADFARREPPAAPLAVRFAVPSWLLVRLGAARFALALMLRFALTLAPRFALTLALRFALTLIPRLGAARFALTLAPCFLRVSAAFLADALLAAAGRAAEAAPPFRPPFLAGALLTGFPRPEPDFFPPPVILLTVAHARFSASGSDTPRAS